jgi:hypothetical protein
LGNPVLETGMSATTTTAQTAGTWTATGSMATPRAGHTATLLTDGKVLVAGGQNTTATSSAEIYDPGTGLWTLTGSMNTERVAHIATLITTGALSGKVLVAGGSSICGGCTPILDSAELYDPSTGLWADTGSMTIARYFESPSPTTLPDGSILIVGGTTCCPYHWFQQSRDLRFSNSDVDSDEYQDHKCQWACIAAAGRRIARGGWSKRHSAD